MRPTWRAWLGAAAALLVMDSASIAAQGAGAGEIMGHALDAAGRPLSGVTVALIGAGQVEVDTAGLFRFLTVPAGTYFLKATRLGLAPVMRSLEVTAGQRLSVNITMDAKAQMLTAVVVRADSSVVRDPTGFARRRESSQGVFISGEDIERRGIERTEQMFNGVPNVRVDTAGIIRVARGTISFKETLIRSRPGVNSSTDPDTYDCIGVQVFVDGVQMPQPFNVNNIPPRSIRGMELYRGPATTPPELRSPRTVCGTLAIWTR
ncbi:MAG: carboxypeptidase regulatory-like domain-containing protein [bacterium]